MNDLLLFFNVATDGNGDISFPWPIPNDPSWDGLPVYYQFLIADPGAADGFSLSEGLVITLY